MDVFKAGIVLGASSTVQPAGANVGPGCLGSEPASATSSWGDLRPGASAFSPRGRGEPLTGAFDED